MSRKTDLQVKLGDILWTCVTPALCPINDHEFDFTEPWRGVVAQQGPSGNRWLLIKLKPNGHRVRGGYRSKWLANHWLFTTELEACQEYVMIVESQVAPLLSSRRRIRRRAKQLTKCAERSNA